MPVRAGVVGTIGRSAPSPLSMMYKFSRRSR